MTVKRSSIYKQYYRPHFRHLSRIAQLTREKQSGNLQHYNSLRQDVLGVLMSIPWLRHKNASKSMVFPGHTTTEWATAVFRYYLQSNPGSVRGHADGHGVEQETATGGDNRQYVPVYFRRGVVRARPEHCVAHTSQVPRRFRVRAVSKYLEGGSHVCFFCSSCTIFPSFSCYNYISLIRSSSC